MRCWLQIALMGTCGTRAQGPNKRHRHGTNERPSEGQVSESKISKNSIVRELGIFCVLEEKGGQMLI